MLTGSVSLASPQHVELVVHVPADSPAEAKVFVAGSVPILGNWRPDGLPLTRQANDAHTAEVDLEPGQSIEFKITRGTWGTVEKNADGSDRPNRTATIDAATQKIEVTVARWANGKPAPRPQSTVVGTLKLHNIDSRHLKQSRTIRVWLPPGYDTNRNASHQPVEKGDRHAREASNFRRFPQRAASQSPFSTGRYDVLYMHDGQNCFDQATSAFGNEWEIDESLTKLITAEDIPPLIVVGIDNGLANRINELTYTADAKRGGGQAAAYAAFLLEEVKPFIERNYRTNTGPAHAFLGGSSLGGLVSLEIARRHPNTFGGVIAMSPALLWADESLTRDIERDPAGLRSTRIWLDVGAQEMDAPPVIGKSTTAPVKPNSAIDSTVLRAAAADPNAKLLAAARRLDAALTTHHITHHFMIDADHPAHNEPAWAARFPAAIRYVLQPTRAGKSRPSINY